MDDTNLDVTLATFVFLARRGGVTVADPAVEAACAALEAGHGEAAQQARMLVEAVRAKRAGARTEDVRAAVDALVGGAAELPADGDRDTRIAGVRRAMFGRNLPWVACIVDRDPDGSVGRHWVLVEAFTDTVKLMDPNPWDDVAEERAMPIGDFMVKWELAGGFGVRVV